MPRLPKFRRWPIKPGRFRGGCWFGRLVPCDGSPDRDACGCRPPGSGSCGALPCPRGHTPHRRPRAVHTVGKVMAQAEAQRVLTHAEVEQLPVLFVEIPQGLLEPAERRRHALTLREHAGAPPPTPRCSTSSGRAYRPLARPLRIVDKSRQFTLLEPVIMASSSTVSICAELRKRPGGVINSCRHCSTVGRVLGG